MPTLIGTVTVLLSLVTIADQGKVFQPALSPDGSQVAYAAEIAGVVRLYVAPTAGGASVPVATIGSGPAAQLYATATLANDPWSPSGERLIVLTTDPSTGYAKLHTVASDGTGLKAVSAAPGTVEAATWSVFQGVDTQGKSYASEVILFAERERPESHVCRIRRVHPANDYPTVDLQLLEGPDPQSPPRVLQIVGSASGRFVALLAVTGPRESRRRDVLVFDGEARKPKFVALPIAAQSPNFLRFVVAGGDRARLTFTDTRTRVYHGWDPVAQRLDDAFTRKDVRYGLPVLGGKVGLYVNAKRRLFAAPLGDGEARDLGFGYVAVSARGGKVAFVRLKRPGGAIIVGDLSDAALANGDLDLD